MTRDNGARDKHCWPLDEDGLWPRLLPDDPEDEPAMVFDWALQVALAICLLIAVGVVLARV